MSPLLNGLAMHFPGVILTPVVSDHIWGLDNAFRITSPSFLTLYQILRVLCLTNSMSWIELWFSQGIGSLLPVAWHSLLACPFLWYTLNANPQDSCVLNASLRFQIFCLYLNERPMHSRKSFWNQTKQVPRFAQLLLIFSLAVVA